MTRENYPAYLSPLKYAGNKGFLAQRLEKLVLSEIDPKSQIVEPFAGSLGFSLHFGFDHVLANDLNRPLINFYRHIQSGLHPKAYSDSEIDAPTYYEYRERFNQLVARGEYGHEMASLLLYLNAVGFNGLMRTGQKKGNFNVPVGKASRFPVEKVERCRQLTDLFSQWTFTSSCYSELLSQLSSPGLIYADPPYIDTFSAYSGNAFGWNQHRELCERLSQSSSPMIVSNSTSNRALLKMYEHHGFLVYRTLVPRRIAAKSSSRTQVNEMVAFKNFKTRRIASLCPELERVRVK